MTEVLAILAALLVGAGGVLFGLYRSAKATSAGQRHRAERAEQATRNAGVRHGVQQEIDRQQPGAAADELHRDWNRDRL